MSSNDKSSNNPLRRPGRRRWDAGGFRGTGSATTQTSRGYSANIAYHHLDDIDQDGGFEVGQLAEYCWAEINFQGTLELPDNQGEVAKREGCFVARIEGRRLEPQMRRIRVGRQMTVHPSGKAPADKPQVDTIEIRMIEPEGM